MGCAFPTLTKGMLLLAVAGIRRHKEKCKSNIYKMYQVKGFGKTKKIFKAFQSDCMHVRK